MDLAAIDCADEGNRKVCTNFGITGYPSLKVGCHLKTVQLYVLLWLFIILV